MDVIHAGPWDCVCLVCSKVPCLVNEITSTHRGCVPSYKLVFDLRGLRCIQVGFFGFVALFCLFLCFIIFWLGCLFVFVSGCFGFLRTFLWFWGFFVVVVVGGFFVVVVLFWFGGFICLNVSMWVSNPFCAPPELCSGSLCSPDALGPSSVWPNCPSVPLYTSF